MLSLVIDCEYSLQRRPTSSQSSSGDQTPIPNMSPHPIPYLKSTSHKPPPTNQIIPQTLHRTLYNPKRQMIRRLTLQYPNPQHQTSAHKCIHQPITPSPSLPKKTQLKQSLKKRNQHNTLTCTPPPPPPPEHHPPDSNKTAPPLPAACRHISESALLVRSKNSSTSNTCHNKVQQHTERPGSRNTTGRVESERTADRPRSDRQSAHP